MHPFSENWVPHKNEGVSQGRGGSGTNPQKGAKGVVAEVSQEGVQQAAEASSSDWRRGEPRALQDPSPWSGTE